MKFNKRFRMFFSPDFGGSFAASMLPPPPVSDPDDGLGETEPQGDPQDDSNPNPEPQPSGQGTGGASTPPVLQFSPDDLGAAIAKAFGQGQQGQQQQQARMTPEEARKALKFWDPDDKWFESFGNMDTQKAALLQMRDGMFEHMFHVMQAALAERLTPLQERFSRFESWETKQENERLVGNFNKSYKQLAAPEFAQLREMVTAHLVQQGARFKTEAEMHKAVADGMASVIRSQRPDFQLDTTSGGSTPPSNQNPNAIKPAPGRGGGGGGSNSNGGNGDGDTRPTAVRFLPPVKPR